MALGDPVAHVNGDFVGEITGSSGFTGNWPAMFAGVGVPGSVAVLVLSCRTASVPVGPTVTFGGVDVTATSFPVNQDMDSPATGTSVMWIATLALTGDTDIADDTVEIEWPSVIGSPGVDIIIQGAVFQNVDLLTFNSNNNVQTFDAATCQYSSAVNDMLVIGGNYVTGTGNAPQFQLNDSATTLATMMEGHGESGEIFYGTGATTSRQALGYASMVEAGVAATVQDINGPYNFNCGFTLNLPAVTVVPPAEDDFNCECEDETDFETLGALRRRMLVRLGFSAQADNPPPGMVDLLNDFLVQSQRYLYRTFKALRTERFFKWEMTEGVRYYDLPDNDDVCSKKLDPYRVTWIGIEDANSVWTPLTQGIPPEFYTGVQFNGLPERYEIRQCIEVFPAPIADLTLRVKGHFGLGAFTADDDKTTIDSELVFMWALANAKAHYGQPDANNLANQANNYRRDLVKGAHQTARYVPGTEPTPPTTRPKFLPLNQ